MTVKKDGIPTLYRGTRYRSRLEARWAAFFDNVGWPYDYEPLDLAGYVPDFVLTLPKADVLVEVKPVFRRGDIGEAVFEKISRSGWQKEALILGAAPLPEGPSRAMGDAALGWLGQPSWDRDEGGNYWRAVGSALPEDHVGPWSFTWCEAPLSKCAECRRVSFYSDTYSYHCRVHGCYDGDHLLGKFYDLEDAWADAANATQWSRAAI